VRLLFAACTDPRGVTTRRPGALERAQLLLDDFRDTGQRLAETEPRKVAVRRQTAPRWPGCRPGQETCMTVSRLWGRCAPARGNRCEVLGDADYAHWGILE
jgi:hypothetical protein